MARTPGMSRNPRTFLPDQISRQMETFRHHQGRTLDACTSLMMLWLGTLPYKSSSGVCGGATADRPSSAQSNGTR